jgi:uncharacterized membrane protein YgdD (TMEM256/DUF423 family)
MSDRSTIEEGIMRERLWIAIAGASGALAVIADAFAAHGARTEPLVADLMGGARYGLLHALALLAVVLMGTTGGRVGVAAARCLGAAGWCFAAGLVLFPGSLYLLGAGAPAAFAGLAPLGGMLFIAGWVALLLFALAPRPAA